jgi:hypothetical protein
VLLWEESPVINGNRGWLLIILVGNEVDAERQGLSRMARDKFTQPGPVNDV